RVCPSYRSTLTCCSRRSRLSPPRPILSRRCALLLFRSCGGGRQLHSFPTRRSSDLQRDLVPRRGLVAGAGPCRHCHRAVATWARDRKSTRLNSSHVSISYAVFCLKKKKRRENADYDEVVRSSRGVTGNATYGESDRP